MTPATLYWAIAILRMMAGLRSEETVVIITQLPAAHAINATWDRPIEMLGHRSTVSINRVSGCQLSAATNPRLPSARIIAVLTRDCLLTRAQPMRRPVANPSRPAITQTINQMPLRAGPGRWRRDRRATGPAGTEAGPQNPRPPALRPLRSAPCSRSVG